MGLRYRGVIVGLALGGMLIRGSSAWAGDSGLWRDISEADLPSGPAVRDITPTASRLLALDTAALRHFLARAPMELTAAAATTAVELPLPMPDGTVQRFRVEEAPIMAPELAREFPELRTYRGQGVEDPTATVRLDLTPRGFHAQILRAGEPVYIDPVFRGDTTHYQCYLKRDLARTAGRPPFVCLVRGDDSDSPDWTPAAPLTQPQAASGSNLRTYRLALAATGEYTAAVCSPSSPAVACGLAAMVTSVNRVDGVYEREVAIRMVLVANNNLLVYTNGATDPYTNENGSTMLGQNQTNLDAVIGSANYDIGHVFSTGGGGIASLAVPCRSGLKARGVTGLSNPVGDAFDIDYVAHEMGHQWSANHTFNGTTGSCGGGNRASSAAYEPGSASTIMGYAGICGAEDLQPHSDAYFHAKSFDEIVAYSTTGSGNSCAATTSTGNHAPSVSAGGSFTIPMQTPFTLSGSATDADSDPLTFGWEELDLGTLSPPQGDSDAARPIFRSFNPTASPSRTFPQLSDVLAGTQTFGEWMSQRTRTMTFRLTARDNRSGGGGVNWATTTVNVNAGAGPFAVTDPTAGSTWTAGSTATVAWNVANTTASPVSCANVDILLSTDSGATFPATLAAATANDGSETVAVPALASTQARVKVVCSTSVFFNVSRPDFTIVCTTPGAFSLTSPADGAGLQGNVVTLQWAGATGASSYDVYLGEDSEPPLLQSTTGTSLSVPLTEGATYHWKVTARGVCGQQAPSSSGVWSYSLAAPLLSATVPAALDVTTAPGLTGNTNGVLEPGESVVLAPRWHNDGAAAASFTSTLSDLEGPAGATYTLLDPTGSYGTVAAGATALPASDAFAIGIDDPTPRPATHWDATVLETLSTGQKKTWTIHIGRSFSDVPLDYWAYAQIEALYHGGYTIGCATDPLRFCPDNLLTRAEMAVFLIRSERGPEFVPPPATGTVFLDVPATYWAAAHIEQLKADGITKGCGDGTRFCPDAQLTRAEMAVFLMRLVHGPSYTPPACTGTVFTDVPVGYWSCDFIEELRAENITLGCTATTYCPDASLQRSEMAVFLNRTLGLQLVQ
jgi:hypothetical protein